MVGQSGRRAGTWEPSGVSSLTSLRSSSRRLLGRPGRPVLITPQDGVNLSSAVAATFPLPIAVCEMFQGRVWNENYTNLNSGSSGPLTGQGCPGPRLMFRLDVKEALSLRFVVIYNQMQTFYKLFTRL